MNSGGRLRGLVVESPGSLGARARSRRWATFNGLFPRLSEMNVIDLGGTVEFWRRAPTRPAHVHLLNPFAQATEADADWLTVVDGDACAPPPRLTSSRFDLVYSNSVIEHVGGHHRRRMFADTVHGLADRHWVQTPYRYFPLEPHWIFPGAQFLPTALRAVVARRWPLLHTRPHDRDAALAAALGTELLGGAEMNHYFPTSRIIRERIGPVTKSLVAVAGATDPG